ncbi:MULTISPECIES: site-specific integrase [Bacteroidaceae]|uniref:site-specific integrase n=1 Tax=Bacteroidaceae TaxID=815 RepID=UPI001F3A894A|nr:MULTISPECIES: site-specific integrase [Bacteroidaceae]MCE8722805.1 site-specific integrase [Phocaeicola vulgatus]
MRMIFKVSYYVRSNYENKQGKSPLMIRIFLNGEMLNVGSSGIYIDKKLWNNSTNRVKGRGSESLNLNAQLDNISNSLQMIFKKHEFDEDLTLDKIKSIFLGKNKIKTTFVEFYDKYLEDIKAQVGAGKSIALYHKYSAARSHFVNFLHAKYGRKDLMPGELTHLIIHDFEIYLKTVVSLKSNSATKTLKFFKTVVIFAQKCGVMTHDPFLNHHFHLEPVDRGFLTDEEIQRIMQKDFEIPRLEMVRDVFIFSCFCGLAYIDVVHLTQENIITLDNRPWIIINRQKTNVQSNIPLLEIPQMILDKYKGKTKDNRLLPVLSNQKINAYLKEIADLCGIKKRLSYHLARHTFATMLLSKGVPIESVSKMLGHTNIKTTQIYARITNKKIEQDMMQVADKFDGFKNCFIN